MYLTPYQKKQLTIVIILLIGIPLTLFGIHKAVQLFTSAAGDTQPRNIVVANVTTNSITVTWTTESKQTGSVVSILNGSKSGTVTDKRGSSKRHTHYTELKNLEPGTKYEFKIISGGEEYSGTDGHDFSFTTANITTDTPVPKPIHGHLEDNKGNDVLIYALPKDKSTYPVATIPSENGNWLLDLSSLRKVSDKSLSVISNSTELVIIASSAVDSGGIVQGTHGNIFDSSGKLTETLISSGTQYDTYIGNESKLIAKEETPVDSEEEKPYVPPIVKEPEEEEPFDRDYELRTDLVWINLVSSDGSTSSTPDSYGVDTVMITNLTDVGFSVLWFSQQKETGHIMYGTSQKGLPDRGRDERDGISSQDKYYLHSIEVTQLEPETKYYFKIYSGEQIYEETFEVTTFKTQATPPQFETISGIAKAEDYQSMAVIATFVDKDEVGSTGESLPISTLVDSKGSWILTTGAARDQQGGYFNKSSNDVVRFKPIYLTKPSAVEMTFGEATTGEVRLTISDSKATFTKIPRLSDYGILVN